MATNDTASWDTGGKTSSKEKEKQSKQKFSDESEDLEDSTLAGNETSEEAAFDANTIDKSETIGEDEAISDDSDQTSAIKEKQNVENSFNS